MKNQGYEIEEKAAVRLNIRQSKEKAINHTKVSNNRLNQYLSAELTCPVCSGPMSYVYDFWGTPYFHCVQRCKMKE